MSTESVREIHGLRLGTVEYRKALDIQRFFHTRRKRIGAADILLLLEHNHVITMGRRANESHVLLDKETLHNLGVEVFETDRGGEATYHGPGQLVVYPIIKWQVGEQSVRNIINRLEDWVMAALADCGIEGYRDERMMGVWLEGYKICSIGLAFKHWVSRHGLALNYNTNPNRVETLSCCGLPAGMTTSLQALGHTHDLEGRILDRVRLEEALLVHAKSYLERLPMQPEDWTVELVA